MTDVECKAVQEVGRSSSLSIQREGGSQRQGHEVAEGGLDEAACARLTVQPLAPPVLPPPRGCGCAGRTPHTPRTNCICSTKLTTCDFR